MSVTPRPLRDGAAGPSDPDPREPVARLLRDPGTGPGGFAEREAARRLQRYGPNELRDRAGRRWPRALGRQSIPPLAQLLLVAAILAALSGRPQLSWAILAVVVLNALFAFFQEHQAGRAVEALSHYLPPDARVRRGGSARDVAAAEIVPGDVLLLGEGDRVPADARLLSGALEIDASALSGESAPVERSADVIDDAARRSGLPGTGLQRHGLCRGRRPRPVRPRDRRTHRARPDRGPRRAPPISRSPLERQVRRVAWLIAAVAVAVGIAFLPLGLLAGLALGDAAVFAVGLLVARTCPEGLLPTITLALAVGVRAWRGGAPW